MHYLENSQSRLAAGPLNLQSHVVAQPLVIQHLANACNYCSHFRYADYIYETLARTACIRVWASNPITGYLCAVKVFPACRDSVSSTDHLERIIPKRPALSRNVDCNVELWEGNTNED